MRADAETHSLESADTTCGDPETIDDAGPSASESDEHLSRSHESVESANADSDEPRSVVDVDDVDNADETPLPKTRRRNSNYRWTLVVGLAAVLMTGGLAGWLAYRTNQSHQILEQRELFLQVGRQAAVNLTTLDYGAADADVQRILDSATGQFYDDFQRRSPGFIELLKKVQSKSEGVIAEAGLESADNVQAQVLVAVRVTTTNAGAPDQRPRAWRMRIGVQMVGADPKVSNVEFVP